MVSRSVHDNKASSVIAQHHWRRERGCHCYDLCHHITVGGNGDQGADPNQLVAITDSLAATTLPAAEKLTTIYSAGFAEVLRGVSFAPGPERTMTETRTTSSPSQPRSKNV